jgi:glycosyltransferase involved in cell wall biosynthesis
MAANISNPNEQESAAIQDQLKAVLASNLFIHAARLGRFLKFVVDETLGDRSDRLNQYAIAVDVFDRDETFDPAIDAIVRVEAGRLRSKLLEYYDDLGRNDFHCVVVGGGPHQSAIRQYAQEIGIDDLCTFTGRVSDEDLCRILSSADMAVDPDPKNDWSDKSTMNKIMEYMYFGLPIVAYDLVENARSGESAAVYVGGNSERGLATEISALLDDPDKRGTMSKFGQKRLREKLAWEYSVPNLLAAYALLFRRRESEGKKATT